MKIPRSIKSLSLVLATTVSVFAASFFALANWSPPPASPPGCPAGSPGCDAPLHVGSGSQVKSGALGVGGVFQADSSAYLAVSVGDVGIGTADPGYKLDVSGTGRFTGDLILGNQASHWSHAVRAGRSIIAGTGLTGGGNLEANRTINADTDYLQRRVGSCSSGQAIRAVSSTGSVTCETVGSGTVTSVGTGTGLTGGTITTSGTISVDSSVVRTSRIIYAGTGLSGGGDLSSNRTISADTSYLQRKINCQRETHSTSVSPGHQVSWSALCPSGYTLTGGGVLTSNTGSVRAAGPTTLTQFRCSVENDTSSSQTYTCVAICCQLF